jgi:hypothetical protein
MLTAADIAEEYVHVLLSNLVEKHRQAVNTQQNFIRCRDAKIVDYMFRPFFIRPSSGLA